MTDILKIADNADMIINGYAFTKDNENIRVLNLNNKKICVYKYRRQESYYEKQLAIRDHINSVSTRVRFFRPHLICYGTICPNIHRGFKHANKNN